ncbi:hypothetical protein [Virgibacillus ndiopensis]|uniref:hypothetical protein n=1 Tax=Virgibacillus ndiopensis TaxID=2004408 RepID=UPI000C08529E|nr:hypothetical protein [Virgibacillus ndiopensis]
MAKAIKNFIIVFFTTFFTKWLEDFLIFTGITLGIVNTYLITVIDANILAGNYVLAAMLIFIGIIIARR